MECSKKKKENPLIALAANATQSSHDMERLLDATSTMTRHEIGQLLPGKHNRQLRKRLVRHSKGGSKPTGRQKHKRKKQQEEQSKNDDTLADSNNDIRGPSKKRKFPKVKPAWKCKTNERERLDLLEDDEGDGDYHHVEVEESGGEAAAPLKLPPT